MKGLWSGISGIIENNEHYSNWKLVETDHKKNSNEFFIQSIREENVPGTHIVEYNSEIDQIAIKHTAYNRKGFALGAVLAAEWIKSKKGVFTMKDVLGI